MITTKRTALSEKEYETKLNTRIEANFETEQARGFNLDTMPVIEPELNTQRITPAKSQDQVMPTIRQERKITPAKEEISGVKSEESTESATANKIDARTKMIMAMYIGVSFILAMIVLATGLALTGQNAKVAGLENSVRQAYNTVVSQQEQIDYLSDEAVVGNAADDLGMVQNTGAEEIELIPLGEVVTYDARTNGFDQFCDFLSNIFGG